MKTKTTRLKVKRPILSGKTDSEKKFGKRRMADAMAYVKAETGAKKLTRAKQYQWAAEIAKVSKKHGQKLNMNTADKIARRTKRQGVEPSYKSVVSRKK